MLHFLLPREVKADKSREAKRSVQRNRPTLGAEIDVKAVLPLAMEGRCARQSTACEENAYSKSRERGNFDLLSLCA